MSHKGGAEFFKTQRERKCHPSQSMPEEKQEEEGKKITECSKLPLNQEWVIIPKWYWSKTLNNPYPYITQMIISLALSLSLWHYTNFFVVIHTSKISYMTPLCSWWPWDSMAIENHTCWFWIFLCWVQDEDSLVWLCCTLFPKLLQLLACLRLKGLKWWLLASLGTMRFTFMSGSLRSMDSLVKCSNGASVW